MPPAGVEPATGKPHGQLADVRPRRSADAEQQGVRFQFISREEARALIAQGLDSRRNESLLDARRRDSPALGVASRLARP
jgi:hypothetical protein